MIVNYPAGGPTDIEGRIVAQHLPAHIPGNPTIVVKNVGGAGGLIGSNQLGEAAPNGETIGFFTLAMNDQLLGNSAMKTALFRFRADRRRRKPAGRLHAQGHAARHQRRDRPDEGQGLQGAVAQRPEHQHAEHGAGARPAGRQVPGGAGLSRAEGRRDRDPAEHRADGQLVAVGLERLGRADDGTCRASRCGNCRRAPRTAAIRAARRCPNLQTFEEFYATV